MERTLDLVAQWLRWHTESRGDAAGTVRLYRRVLTRFVIEVVKDGALDSVSPERIEKWLQRPRGGRAQGMPAMAATQHRDASCIRGFYAWLYARGEIAQNPAQLVSTPTVRNRNPRPIGDATWQKLWGHVEGADAVVLGLGFFCGLRREEVTMLRVYNVDIGARRICNFGRKGGGEHTLPVGTMLATFAQKLPHLGADRLWPIVNEWCGERGGNEFLVGWNDLGRPRRSNAAARREPGQLAPQHLNHWLHRMSDAVQAEHVHPHQLRHSCATNLIRAGVPIPIVSTLMNHASISTTMRYVKAGGDELSEWLDNQV